MNIGELSKISGVSDKMIRHYESIGLLPKAKRSESGYRQYSEKDAHNLIFIKRSRQLGFSTAEIKTLIGLWKNKSRTSKEVKKLATTHLEELEKKISDLQEMADSIRHLVHCCSGDDRPECPILENLTILNK